VLGQPCAPSLAALPAVPELVALCVPAQQVPAVVDSALELGVRGFLAVAAGVADEAGLAHRVRAGGARLLGPNSLGVVDTAGQLQLAWGHFTAGPLAVVSQSGQVGSEVVALAARAGVGVSRFVSIGSSVDVTAAELLEDLVRHQPTRVVALYLESFAGGRELVEAMRRLRAAGKHTVVLTIGASDAGRRAARSHTGSLASSLDVVDAACRAAGAVRVDTPTQLVELVRLLLAAPLPAGRRVGVVGDSGGQAGLASDVAAAHRLQVLPLPQELQQVLAEHLPPAACVSNPVDLAGAGEADLGSYADVVERLLGSEDLDGVVLTGYFGCYGEDVPTLVERELAVVARLAEAVGVRQRPLVVHTMGADGPAASALWAQGVPAYATIEAAVGALARACALSDVGRDGAAGADRGAPDETAPDETAPDETAPDETAPDETAPDETAPYEATSDDPAPGDPAPGAAAAAQDALSDGRGYWAARELLVAAGVAFPAAARLRTPAELAGAAAAVPPPYVLKAGWLEHKSEQGGVQVGIAGEQLEAAFRGMHSRLGEGDYVLEQQDLRAGAVEILVGARQDPHLGALVVVGAGGVEAELHRDVVVELAPVDDASALAMVRRLRCFPLLEGWRGRPATDLPALAQVIAAVSRLAARRPELAEIELNPVRVAPQGALAVDVLVVPAAGVGSRLPAADR
jgi:acyl-CoA synthetase (NDP forming)